MNVNVLSNFVYFMKLFNYEYKSGTTIVDFHFNVKPQTHLNFFNINFRQFINDYFRNNVAVCLF